MIVNFVCLKNQNKEKEGQPDYRLSANIGSKEQPHYVDIGVGWKKESEKGHFISLQLNKPFKDKKGWKIEAIEPTESSVKPQELRSTTKAPEEDKGYVYTERTEANTPNFEAEDEFNQL